MLSINGLPKSGYFIFMFLAKDFLDKVNINNDFFISRNIEGSKITIFLYNYVHLGIGYYYDSNTFHKYNIYTAFEKGKENIYHIDLSNIINKEENYKVLIETSWTN